MVDSGLSSRSRSLARTRALEPAPAGTVIESSAPPILQDDDMATIGLISRLVLVSRSVEIRPARVGGYRDETGGGGSGSEGVSDGDVVLSADEPKTRQVR